MHSYDHDPIYQAGVTEAFNSGVEAAAMLITELATSDTDKIVFGSIIDKITALQKRDWKAAPPLPAVGWRDIATAPKDGTPIDIWVKGYPSRRIVNMKWDEHDYGFRNHSDPEQGWMEDEEITHYMPIPAPPTAQGGEES